MKPVTIVYLRQVLARCERMGWPESKVDQAYQALNFRRYWK